VGRGGSPKVERSSGLRFERVCLKIRGNGGRRKDDVQSDGGTCLGTQILRT
jgi:hypothetical protein